jgi:hypothetical protein
MNRAMLLDHLAQSERHLIEGIGRIERQKQVVVDLACRGYDSTEPRASLTQFRELQKMHEAHRSLLMKILSLTDADTR